jgi:hypothetical protein
MSREDHLVVWPLLVFIGVIVILLTLDHAWWWLFELGLALYGPLVVLLGAYALYRSAARGIWFMGRRFKQAK